MKISDLNRILKLAEPVFIKKIDFLCVELFLKLKYKIYILLINKVYKIIFFKFPDQNLCSPVKMSNLFYQICYFECWFI